nr:flagellar assembly protein FliH [Ramlibacter aurantiacus]
MEQGRQDGVRQVEASLAGSAAQAARHLQAIAQGLQGELARMEQVLADQVVGLAIGIARQVLRREVALDPQALLPAAGEALQQLAEGAGRIELQVNPQDAHVLRGHLERQTGLPPWQLREDPALPRGGCRAVADTGEIDATLAGRWEAVMASLGRAAETAP